MLPHEVMLAKKGLFFININSFLSTHVKDMYIGYAPLADAAFVCDADGIETIYNANIRQDTVDNHYTVLFEKSPEITIIKIPEDPSDLFEIDILVNHRCNFSCSYCYSAKGRANDVISFDTIKKFLNYIFLHRKIPKARLLINFSGGGEPLLDFPLIVKSVLYIEELYKKNPLPYRLGIVTNGSLITNKIIDFIHEHSIELVVSFQGIEELQNDERGMYQEVAASLDLLLERNIPFAAKSTLTPNGLSFMSKIVQHVGVRFPKLKAITFEAVLSKDLFPTEQSIKDYYTEFTDNFYVAKELGKTLGISIHSTSFTPTRICREKTCIGKLSLTPHGNISFCSRVSSEKEELFNDFIYGKVLHSGEMYFDLEKFHAFQQKNIFTQEDCHMCFARFNCGGGCKLFELTFPYEYRQHFCNFTRSALKHELYSKIEYEIVSQGLSSSLEQYIFDASNKI